MRPFERRLRGGILTRKAGIMGWPPRGGRWLWLLSSTAIVSAVALSQPILAADECGTGSSVVCDSNDAGYRFAGQSFYLQPRARLSYAHAWAGSFADGSGMSIDLENSQTLVGEAALRYGARVALKGVDADFYVEAGARHEFLGATEAEVSGLSYTHELPGTSGLVAGGVTVPLLADKLSLVVESSYAKGEDTEEFTATGALRVMY